MKIQSSLVLNLFNFRDRGSRKEWWLTHIFLFSATLVLILLLEELGINVSNSSVAAAIIIGIALLNFLISSSVSIRRLHDAGYSAWYYLLAFIPYIGGVCLLILVCIPPDPEANKYGEPAA